MREVIFVAVAGALGALSRWGITELARRTLGDAFPYGTFIANVLGCFLLGLLMGWTQSHPGIPRSVRLALTMGFLGALTTFSTFSFQSVEEIAAGRVAVGVLNIALSLAVGLTACAGGLALGRALGV